MGDPRLEVFGAMVEGCVRCGTRAAAESVMCTASADLLLPLFIKYRLRTSYVPDARDTEDE